LSCGLVVASCAVTFGIFNKVPVERLEDAGCEVRLNPYGRPLTPAEIVEHAKDADVIILGNDRLDSATIGKLPNLKLVVRHGAGLDNIDFSELGKRDITVANTPGANKEETADLTFAFILDLARMVTQSINQLKGGVWNKIPGRTLYGKTIGIIGVGAIGMAVASRAMGFGMDILGNDIIQRDEAARFGLLYTSLNELLSASDVVTIHAPLTSATKNLIGARELKRMKPGALLINTACAGVVREAALEKALMSGHLGGYAVDVYAKEPPDPTSYMSLPNVLTTPHIGSSTMEANLRMGDMAVDNILAFMNGAVLPNKVTVVDRLRFS
jgi:D-3-phosphoglycerate dehydrogenase